MTRFAPWRERLFAGRAARWLFRLRGPERSPIVLRQRRIYVLPSGAGFVFAIAVALLLVGAVNYQLSLAYLLTFLLAGLGIVAILHTWRNLAGLVIEAGRTEPAFAGEPCGYTLLLRNPREAPRPAIRVRARAAEPTLVDLPAQGTTAVALRLPTHRRGWQPLGRVTLETRHPLSLVRAWSYVEPDMRCLVYPRPEARCPPLPSGIATAGSSAHGGRGEDDFAGLRRFNPSDSPRHVAWKAVARGAPPLTKQFDGAAGHDIWLDWDQLPATLGLEDRLSRLTAWVLAAQTRGLAFGLRLPGRSFDPDNDELHVQACLKALALHALDGH